MTAFAVAIYVYQVTGSASWVSIAALLAFLPTILLHPIGGILADRYDRRLMMIWGDTLSAAGLVFILICLQSGHTGVMPILIGVTISSIFLALLEPAYKATVTDLLSEEEYARASALVQLAGASKYLISPFLAGLILTVTDVRVIFIIDIATIAVTVLAAASVRKGIRTVTSKKEKQPLLRELREGMKWISGDPGVSRLVVLMAFVCFFIAFIQTLMTPMILAFADVKTLGMMESVSAVGLVIGSVVVGMLNVQKGYAKLLVISLMASGVCMAMVGTTTRSLWIVIFCFLFFSTLPFIQTSAEVLIRLRVPNDVQGRVWGMISILTQMGYAAAYAVCGVLADYVFSPLLMEDGLLASSVGKLIGTGEGRGIGLMLILSGILMLHFAWFFGSRTKMKEIERSSYELGHS